MSFIAAAAGAPSRPAVKTITVGGVNVTPVTMEEAIAGVSRGARPDRDVPFTTVAVNAHFVVSAQKDERLRAFLNRADLSVADGVSLLLAARVLGKVIPQRIPGIDLMVRICERAAAEGQSVYLLGGRPDAARLAAETLLRAFPGLKVAGIDRPPLGREFEPDQAVLIRERIRKANPDYLFVCFGVPLQEYWIEQYAMDLPVSFVMGNGAAFDVLAGFFTRPAEWIQRCGLEWLYRLAVEPGRLWHRYLVGNSQFVTIAFRQAALALPARALDALVRRVLPQTTREALR
jgi:N-acetylglucosaminyldiphosphoundecaprenol N-acetyl-beta-D-mannosaminyltransferase